MPNGQPPAWLTALPSLFAIGAKLGGAPTVGTAAIHGAEQGKLLAEQSQLRQEASDQRSQQLNLQTEALMAQQAARQEQQEQRRQQAIRTSIDDLRAQKFPTRKEYESAVGAHEQMLGQFFGVRPNTLRTLVPYTGPTAASRAKEAMETLTKQPNWQQIVTGNGVIKFDRDDDGIEEMVPVLELAEMGGFPISRDPQSGQPMLPPKDVKPENVQEFDQVYAGVLEEKKAEGKDINDPRVKGQAATEARTRISKASKTGNASVQVTVPERPMTRYQRFTAEKGLRDDATKLLEPIRDLNRQVTVMRAGLDHINTTGRLDAGTQAVINTFNRIMEPGSVTREAEYMRTTLGQPVFESLSGQWQRLTKGGAGVTKESLQLVVQLAEDIAGRLQDSVRDPLRMISEQATEFQIPVDRVVPAESSYRLKQRQQVNPPTTQAPAQGGAPAVGSVVTMKDGRRVRVDGINPDGSIKGTVVR